MKQVVTRFSALLLSGIASVAGANCTSITDTTQANFQAGVANGVDTAASPGNVVLAQNAGGGGSLDQQNTSITNNGEKFSNSTNTQWAGQTFTAQKSGSLTQVDVNIFCVFCGSPPPKVVVSIRATSGGLPTGPDLASTTFAISDYTGTQVWNSAVFAAPATVTAGTQYALLLHPQSAVSGTFAFSDSAVNTTTGNDVYPGGAVVFSVNGGSSWAVETGPKPSVDAGFKTYVSGGTGGGYVSAGDLISSTKDAAPPSGSVTNWNTLSWTASVPTNTTLRFQAAASNNLAGPFAFVGPDGTANSFFTATNADLSRFNGNRYLKYRAFLGTGSSASTPTLNDASVCYTNAPPSADLSISNSDGVSSATPGGSVTYAITAANAGPNGVTGATVTDTFPTALTCSWTCTGAGGGACPASGTGSINSNINLPAGGSANFSATCSISASASGTLTNTASIAAPAGVTDPVSTNNTASDSDTLVGTGAVAMTISDNVDKVRIGDVVSYVIELTNDNGPASASITLTDSLPAQLNNGSWVCSASGGASCGSASGSGSKLSDVSSLPNGGKLDYLYTATVVSADANGEVSNTAAAKVQSGGGAQSTTNLNTSDADMVVIFASSFDGGGAAAAMKITSGAGGGGSSLTIDLGVDAGLLNRTGVAPVTLATGRAADGKALFRVQLTRLGYGFALRTLTTIDDSAFSAVAPWTPIDLGHGVLTLAWHSASAAGDDGYLRVGSLPAVAHNLRVDPARLQIATDRGVPWLVHMSP